MFGRSTIPLGFPICLHVFSLPQTKPNTLIFKILMRNAPKCAMLNAQYNRLPINQNESWQRSLSFYVCMFLYVSLTQMGKKKRGKKKKHILYLSPLINFFFFGVTFYRLWCLSSKTFNICITIVM